MCECVSMCFLCWTSFQKHHFKDARISSFFFIWIFKWNNVEMLYKMKKYKNLLFVVVVVDHDWKPSVQIGFNHTTTTTMTVKENEALARSDLDYHRIFFFIIIIKYIYHFNFIHVETFYHFNQSNKKGCMKQRKKNSLNEIEKNNNNDKYSRNIRFSMILFLVSYVFVWMDGMVSNGTRCSDVHAHHIKHWWWWWWTHP